MAEAIILPLATSVLTKIASFTGALMAETVTEEIKGLKSVTEDLKAISEDLECITSVLHDAEANQYTNAALKIWLRDLKSIVYDIDDLLDEVATDALQRSVNKGHLLPQLWYYLTLTPLILRFDLSHKIKDLRLKLEHIVVKKNKFGLTDRPIEAPSVERNVLDTCGYVDKLGIVGRDGDKNNIINRITSLRGECSVSVFPIIGMGGIGKTALAKLVYNDIDQFDIKLWVCVSDKFDLQKILEDILKDATGENMSNYSLRLLIEKLQFVMKGKKYFLVLDDLWEDDIKLWMELRSILDVGGIGSVILITTRIEKVASNTQTVKRYNLDKLPDSVTWCIFKKLAFKDGEEERCARLSEIGLSIVKKCCGIPLVVQCLGSLLRSERDEREWLRINNMDNLNQLDGQYNTVKLLLKLSYDKLPSHIKPIFAHLSLRPKDCVYGSIHNSYWLSASGLLQISEESYFNHNFYNELLSRSMLQDVKWRISKTIGLFKIHDILHDLAGDILGEELAVVTRNNLRIPDSSRYIAWGFNDLTDKEFPIKAKKARAFIFQFVIRSVVSQPFLKGIISNMPCLRILDLGGTQIEELPNSIRNLKHLRFLELSNNALIKSLPYTICELLNLEYLGLGGCKQLEELPSKIYKLINLRCFFITTRQSSLVGTKFNRLPSLQHVFFTSCMELVSLWDKDDVGRLTSIRTLEIVHCPKLRSLPNSMKLLVGLESLRIINCEELDLDRGDGSVSGLQSLQTLQITGVSRLTCLPNGMCSAVSSLKYLYIRDCKGLVELPNGLQSFASLESLYILDCHNLLSLPEGIRHLKSLQYLEIDNCSHLSRRCATPDGEDVSLIRHIPVIWLDRFRLTPNQQ